MRGNAIGMILQDPFTMLNPVMRVGRILVESLPPELARRPRAEKRQEAIRRLAEVGIHDPSVVDRYPFQLSGGMRQRVAIAAALACDPELLIADEPSTALDVTTQHEILSLIKDLQRSRGMGVLLITHDLRLAFGTCDRVHVFYAGSLLEVASSADLEHEPLHPYSHGLLLSEPPADRKLQAMLSDPGIRAGARRCGRWLCLRTSLPVGDSSVHGIGACAGERGRRPMVSVPASCGHPRRDG